MPDYYQKRGRRYLPAAGLETLDVWPLGTHLLLVRPGGRTCHYRRRLDRVALLAAAWPLQAALCDALASSEPQRQPLSAEQRAAWGRLNAAFGPNLPRVYTASRAEITEAAIDALVQFASERRPPPPAPPETPGAALSGLAVEALPGLPPRRLLSLALIELRRGGRAQMAVRLEAEADLANEAGLAALVGRYLRVCRHPEAGELPADLQQAIAAARAAHPDSNAGLRLRVTAEGWAWLSPPDEAATLWPVTQAGRTLWPGPARTRAYLAALAKALNLDASGAVVASGPPARLDIPEAPGVADAS